MAALKEALIFFLVSSLKYYNAWFIRLLIPGKGSSKGITYLVFTDLRDLHHGPPWLRTYGSRVI